MESVLGAVKRMEIEVTPPSIDALLAATHTLEAVIAPCMTLRRLRQN
jgi:hypothetical protein